MNQKQSWEEKIHLKLLEKSESAKNCGEMTVVKIGFLPAIIKEIVDEAIQTREREISEVVRAKADAEIRATIHPVFHPTFSDGVNSGRIAAFTEVLSIINNKSL